MLFIFFLVDCFAVARNNAALFRRKKAYREFDKPFLLYIIYKGSTTHKIILVSTTTNCYLMKFCSLFYFLFALQRSVFLFIKTNFLDIFFDTFYQRRHSRFCLWSIYLQQVTSWFGDKIYIKSRRTSSQKNIPWRIHYFRVFYCDFCHIITLFWNSRNYNIFLKSQTVR